MKKYIGAYSAVMGGLDAVLFTAGIGENAIEIREEILVVLEYLGIKIDKQANNYWGKEKLITAEDSQIKAMVIPTNEELVIAQDTKKIISSVEV